MDLIIFTHPDNEKSHNAAILKHVTSRLRSKFMGFEVIDLYADGFDPVLRLTKEDGGRTKLIGRYRAIIEKADRLIFISPVWWYNMPAMLKGFIDIIFSPGFAHDFNPQDGKLRKKLTGKKAIIINTYGRSQEECDKHKQAPTIVLDDAVLKFTGIEVISRIDWFDVRPPSLIPKGIMARIDGAILDKGL